MKIQVNKFFVIALAVGCLICRTAYSQSDANAIQVKSTENAKAKSDADLEKRALEWIGSLNLNDAAKQERVAAAVATHLKAIRDWHNEHPVSTVPAGINPATGNKLSDLDRQIIATSAMPKNIHDALMNILNRELTPSQVELVLDKYTVGKVAFTLAGYKAIVPDLTSDEEAKITSYLKQAREQAIDYKNMKEISAIFEIYKTKCEQLLNNNGRNWRQLYKAYTDAVKAKKAADKQKPAGN
jgi:MinD superfamily P-loop ATPase